MVSETKGAFRTLNVHVPWTEVLQAFDIPVASRALPARVQCPACLGAKLTIYEDNISGGEWHYCFDCNSHGDMIELAANVWRIPIKAAVRKLAREVCVIPETCLTLNALNSYKKYHVDRRTDIATMWQLSREYLIKTQSDTLKNLRGKFRIASHLSTERWRNYPGQMVGAYTKTGVEIAILPDSFYNGALRSSQRVFKGRKWGDVIVVPHYSVPGRICGFLFVGRAGTQEDTVYKVLGPGHNIPEAYQKPWEAGLGCLWAAYNAQTTFNDNIVAIGDTFLALRLQVRNASTSNSPLPLVSYYDSPMAKTRFAWAAIAPKKVTVWGWRMTAGLLYQAISADANMLVTYLTDTTQERIDHYVRDGEPCDIIKSVIRDGKPWRKYLVDWADKVNDNAVADLMLEAEAYQLDIPMLAELSPRIRKFCHGITRTKVVRLANRANVTEKNGKWWSSTHSAVASKKISSNPNAESRLIMNATLRIDSTRVEKRGDEEVVLFVGRLRYEGQEIAFELPHDRMIASTATELTALLAKHCPGAVLFIATHWNRQLLEAGMLFSKAG